MSITATAENSGALFMETGAPHYNVRLESFEGPLDLLLHLIKKNEVDIYDIPIAVITRQYLEYLNLMKELNLDIAGEFLVMASTLIQIKSRTLLPSLLPEEEGEEEEDPRAELVRRLLEYHKYKEASHALNSMDILGRDLYARKFQSAELDGAQSEDEFAEVGLYELVEALQSILAKIPVESFHEVGGETIPLADRINEILTILQENPSPLFEDLLTASLSREYIVVTFLAILELCRLKLIRIFQAARYGSIHITPTVTDISEMEITEERLDFPAA